MPRTRLPDIAAAALLLIQPLAAAPAPDVEVLVHEVAEIPTPVGDVSFGSPLAISGDTLVVGGRINPQAAVYEGVVHVYVLQGGDWTLQATLGVDDDPDASRHFGRAVDLDGDTLIVGAGYEDPLAPDAKGAAYVFTRNGSTWSESAKLLASDGEAMDGFGEAVAVCGDRIAVGATGHDSGAAHEGAVYLYSGSGSSWSLQAKLVAACVGGTAFGHTLALDADTLVVGSACEVGGVYPGTAHVFEHGPSGWVLDEILAPSDGEPSDGFGGSLGLQGDTLVVGAHRHDALGSDSGATYVFVRGDGRWSEAAKLTPQGGEAFDYFGRSVAVQGGWILVGAPNGGWLNKGVASLFEATPPWGEIARVEPSDPAYANLAVSVALSDAWVLLSDQWINGSVYVCPAPDFGVFTDLGPSGAPGLFGEPILSGQGDLTPGSSVGFCLSLQGGFGSTSAMLFAALGPGTPTRFKGGTLYPFPVLTTVPVSVDVLGSFSLPAVLPAGVPPGSRFTLQVWLADRNAPHGAAGSNGVLATIP